MAKKKPTNTRRVETPDQQVQRLRQEIRDGRFPTPEAINETVNGLYQDLSRPLTPDGVFPPGTPDE